MALKAGFKQDQPRFPKGAPNGPGRWSGGPGTSGSGGAGGKAPSEEPPEEKPPTSRERTSILKEVARRIQRTGETIVAVAKMGTWIVTYSAHINAYNDPPKSLEELQRGASTPAAGYDIHHIVEQTPAERDGFSRDVIDGPDNLVRVPRLKHQEINGWYQRPNADYGWQTPREYLSGRNWEVRRSVGLQALKIHGVLKP
ncbi:MAG: hypothetical protein GC182_15945 [Rhodopseudomonas sp.]|nr:hypothetical protein [Rhodopseudomonas sp.]